MPKVTKYPRLRSHVRKGAGGQRYVYFYYDMRPDGLPDVPLGKEHAAAIAQWEELHLKKPRIKGTCEEAFTRWEKEKLPEYISDETRKGYAKNLKKLREKFSKSTWDAIQLHHLVSYLKTRIAKVQGNREISLFSVIWNQARIWGITTLPWPAAGMERSKWKNEESAREFEVTDLMFDVLYTASVDEPMLRDCLDLSTATGMRLTDCREVLLPANNILRIKASKTGKKADFDISLSEVLPGLLVRRRSISANHLMLLSMPDGSPVTQYKLRGAYDRARERAAVIGSIWNDTDFVRLIRSMVLRDMRKRASDLAGSDEEASHLLQHSSVGLTKKHYRSKITKIKTVR